MYVSECRLVCVIKYENTNTKTKKIVIEQEKAYCLKLEKAMPSAHLKRIKINESTKSIPRTDVLKGLYRIRSSNGWRQVHQPCYAGQMELLFSRVGNARCHVIGLFLILCLGAAVVVAFAWVFVQILLWMEE